MSDYVIEDRTQGNGGGALQTDDAAVHFGHLAHLPLILSGAKAAHEALEQAERRFAGLRLALRCIAYQAAVYHGGTLHGLGIWARGRRWSSRARAAREGERLAAQCRQTVGGDPVVEISVVTRR